MSYSNKRSGSSDLPLPAAAPPSDSETQPAAGESVLLDFYSGANVFLTGATGFMGKVVLEKLLRTVPDIGTVYILVRPKKGQDPEKRVEALFEDPVFGRLREERPKFRHQVVAIPGDCSVADLGLSESDRRTLIDNVNVIFHGAATVRFDEKINIAVDINVLGTKRILELAKEMTNLKVTMHISTAYSHCYRKDVKEQLYDVPIDADRVVQLVRAADEKILEKLDPLLIDKWPNSYAFTKALGEDVVKRCSADLPIGVFRPGIVVSTANEPVPGWIDNLYGPTGVVVGAGCGLIHTLQAGKAAQTNIVPVDLAVNSLLAAAWECANLTKEERNMNADIPVYNYVSTVENPLTWKEFMDKSALNGWKAPTSKAVWAYSLTLTDSRIQHILLTAFLHFLPALLVDAACHVINSPFRLMKVYKKIYKFSDVISYFSTREWKFNNDRVQALWRRLGGRDRELFPFSMRDLDWDAYFPEYILGVRLYLLKDDPKTIPQSIVRHRRFYVVHQALKVLILFLAVRLCWALVVLAASWFLPDVAEEAVFASAPTGQLEDGAAAEGAPVTQKLLCDLADLLNLSDLSESRIKTNVEFLVE